MRNQILNRSVLTLMVLGLILPVLMTARTYEESFDKSFSVKSGGTLTVDSNIGDVAVTGSGGSKVDITVEQKFYASGDRELEQLKEHLEMKIDQQGNDVIIYVRFHRPEGNLLKLITGNQRWPQIKFIMTVPEKYNLDLKTGDGDVVVSRIEGDVDCRTSDGDVAIDQITGPVTLKTSDGDVIVNDINGILEARTSDGDISASGCSASAELTTSDGDIIAEKIKADVNLRTSDGDVVVEETEGSVTATTSDGDIMVNGFKGNIQAKTSDGNIQVVMKHQPDSSCSLKTSDGNIGLRLAEDIKATINAKASDGHVSTDFPVKVSGKVSKNRLYTELNGGGPELMLQTSDGNITISH